MTYPDHPYLLSRGFSLLELIASLAIFGGIILSVLYLTQNTISHYEVQADAGYLRSVSHASRTYIENNFQAIIDNATETTPVLITLAQLTAHLPEGTPSQTLSGQTVCVLVLEPAAGKLTALVLTDGGSPQDDATLAQIAVSVGVEGGSIYENGSTGNPATETAKGALHGWQFVLGAFANDNTPGGGGGSVTCDGAASGKPNLTPGHSVIALWLTEEKTENTALYRNSMPDPTLNTMEAPITLGAGAIRNVNSACTDTGALARNSDGQPLSCEGGVWKINRPSFWYPPSGSSTTAFGYGAACPFDDPGFFARWPTDQAGVYTQTGAIVYYEETYDHATSQYVVNTSLPPFVVICENRLWVEDWGGYFYTEYGSYNWTSFSGSISGTFEVGGNVVEGSQTATSSSTTNLNTINGDIRLRNLIGGHPNCGTPAVPLNTGAIFGWNQSVLVCENGVALALGSQSSESSRYQIFPTAPTTSVVAGTPFILAGLSADYLYVYKACGNLTLNGDINVIPSLPPNVDTCNYIVIAGPGPHTFTSGSSGNLTLYGSFDIRTSLPYSLSYGGLFYPVGTSFGTGFLIN